MDDDKNKGFKGSYKASLLAQETSPIPYKLNCRITSTGCRRDVFVIR